ncbi:MAG: hypothetical protein U9P90_02270 [Patescibacteria group bacterium]|nr:hypothetical protein [Patescibacteria group bacterium]
MAGRNIAAVSVTHDFVDGNVLTETELDENYGDIVDYINNTLKGEVENSQYIDPDAVENNIAIFDADGKTFDSGSSLSDVITDSSTPLAINIKNLIPKNDTDTAHDINFYSSNTNYDSEVLMRDSSYDIFLRTKAGTFELTKKLDATWAAGDDAGGLDDNDSLAVDTWYYCFALGKSTDDTARDYVFSDDVTGVSALTDAAVVTAGYDLISIVNVGSVLTDASSNILNGTWTGLAGGGIRFIYDTAIFDINDSSPSGVYADGTVSAPENSFLIGYMNGHNATGVQLYLYALSKVDGTEKRFFDGNTTNNGHMEFEEILVDSSNNIQYKSTNASSYTLYTRGYIQGRTS